MSYRTKIMIEPFNILVEGRDSLTTERTSHFMEKV
jgi:hypothetical protein